ncbi:MAG TPA: endonuclease/exonuclease/phosphatase family protein [Flavobacterium sp.]|nr:endonuclease/exonuclease/phosphatase family protein [Flavobacterium sp.]
MRIKNLTALLVALVSISASKAQDKKFKVHTVAFYNFENLFDTINNADVNDEEYTPSGDQRWTIQKYRKKLDNLSRVLNEIGINDQQKEGPIIIGGSEIENRGVLEDLVKHPTLAGKDFGIVHFDSPDKRGIDVALLYQKKHFKPTSYINVPLIIYDQTEKTRRIYTRDQLVVTGILDGEEMTFIVNHWPSRSGGEKKSSPNREAAGRLNRKIIDSLYNINPNAKIVTMGDLNDGPTNKSVKAELQAKGKKEEVKERGIYNPMEEMANKGIGSLAYRDAWDLFDQMLVSEPLIRKDYSSYRFWKAGVYNKPFLTQTTGQFKGYPLRNSNGQVGFSDHFPVYLYLIKEVK